jgi:hypothetical protein
MKFIKNKRLIKFKKQLKSDNQINYAFKNLKEAPSIVEELLLAFINYKIVVPFHQAQPLFPLVYDLQALYSFHHILLHNHWLNYLQPIAAEQIKNIRDFLSLFFIYFNVNMNKLSLRHYSS